MVKQRRVRGAVVPAGVMLVIALCLSSLALAEEPAQAQGSGARYVALAPTRILDTRNDTQGAFDTPWTENETRAVQVTGLAGVPVTGVESVTVHITTVNATAPISWLTVTPTGDPVSTTAVLNFGTDQSGHTLTNDMVIAKVGTDGQINVTNAFGDVDLVIDLVGYHTSVAGGTSLLVGSEISGVTASDQLGRSVSLSSSGHRVAVGVPEFGTSEGYVAVFEDIAGTWTQVGSNIEAGDRSQGLGTTVALNAAGDRVAMGAPTPEGFGDTGPHVRVYEYDAGTWSQMGANIEGEGDLDEFGSALAINDAGDRIVVGGPFNDGLVDNGGHAQVYQWSGTAWAQLGGDIDGAAIDDRTGTAVGMNAAGDRIAVGASGAGTGGEVGVYEWTGSTWALLGSKTEGASGGDFWGGRMLSMNAAGDRFVASADFNDDNGGNAGHARVFGWTGSAWTQFGSAITGEATGDRAGRGLAMNDAGDRVAVGSVFNDDVADAAGHIRLFEWSGIEWEQVGADIGGEAAGDNLGTAVALNGAGDRLAGGAPFNDGAADDAGHVLVFDIAPAPTVFVPVAPERLLDSRNETEGEYETAWAPGQTRSVQITGLAGVPAAATSAVVNITTVNATAPSSWLTVTPAGEPASTTAVLNYGTDPSVHSITNDLIVAKLSADGKIDITNALGTVDIVVDLIGFHRPLNGTDFVALPAARILDTRNAVDGIYDTPWTEAETRAVPVTGVGGVPPSGADSVVLHVTTVHATAPVSWLTVTPSGNPPPATANLNFGSDASGHSITNDIVIAKIGTNGSVDITNAFGTVDIVIDVVGYHT